MVTGLCQAYIGPVSTPLYNFNPKWQSSGGRVAVLAGAMNLDAAHQLSELADNRDARITVGGEHAVLLPMYFTSRVADQFIGWYLLDDFTFDPYWIGEVPTACDFSLKATYLGHQPEVVIDRTSVPNGNDFSLTARSLVVSPFRPNDDAGDRFIVDPGGTFRTRAYDPNDYDPAVPTPTEVAAIGYYEGTVSDSSDDVASVCFPRLAWAKEPPKWLTQQGGSVWAYDRRCDRDVLGPHPYLETTDLLVDNGLVRFWIGNRGLRPFLNCQAFDGETWREPGTVQFGSTSSELVGARLVATTAEYTTIALTVADKGDILVSLYRGEPMLRVSQPAGMPLPVYDGIPPASRRVTARVTDARFDNGLVGGIDIEDTTWAAPFATWAGDEFHSWDGSPYTPDLRLRWPADVPAAAWSSVWRYQPIRDLADLGTVGLRTLYSAGGIAEVELYVDEADSKAKVRVGDTVVIQSAVLNFTADDDLLIGLRYDGTTLTLSWCADNGTITHTSAAAAIDGDVFHDDTYFVNFSRFGDDPVFGDEDIFGGVTHFPGGVIDNDMVFERALTSAEFAALALADTPLEGLPTPEGALRRYAPFDAQPLVSMSLRDAHGRSADPVTDDNGFTKFVAALNAELTDVAAFLATSTPGDTAADQHAQAAAQNNQRVRVR